MRLPAKRAQVWQRTRQFTFSQEELNMGRPRLTEYLLKLATDAEELELYEFGPERLRLKLATMTKRQRDAALKKNRDGLLRRAGITPEQRKRVLTGNSRAITETVVKELIENASTQDPFYGTGLAVVTPIGRAHLQVAHAHMHHAHLQHHVRRHSMKGRKRRAMTDENK
jgi:hypothetical protein